MKIIDQVKQFLEKSKDEVEYLKSTGNPDAARFLDKKFLISAGVFLVVALLLYVYIIIFVYKPTPSIVTNERTNVNNPSIISQTLKGQALTNLYASMKLNTYSNAGSPSGSADIFKIPANYMAVKKVPVTETENYVKVFDVVYDFFMQADKGDYKTALLYLNKDFAANNKITPELLSKYFKETYYDKFTFNVLNVTKTNNIYSARLLIVKKDATDVGFTIIYTLTETNGKLDISINDLAKYAKE